MIQQYLDKDGYPMDEERKPIFLLDEKKARSMQRVARYITCPETGMLKWIGHCEGCKWFKGYAKYRGVKCSYKKIKVIMKEKTRLLQIVEQKAEQVCSAIEQAIDEGAKIEGLSSSFVTIDDVFLQKDSNCNFAIVLRFESKEIAKLFEPSKEDLEKIAEQKRAELAEIEKQINSK